MRIMGHLTLNGLICPFSRCLYTVFSSSYYNMTMENMHHLVDFTLTGALQRSLVVDSGRQLVRPSVAPAAEGTGRKSGKDAGEEGLFFYDRELT